MSTPAVTFDKTVFLAGYPQFAALSDAQFAFYFSSAGLYCANDICNPAFCAGILPQLLYLLTAHIAWLNAPRDANGNPAATGAPPSPIVGRISSASEGSVSVSSENSYPPGSAQWYQQTPWGSQYYEATAQFRTFRYAAQPTIVGTGLFPGYGYFGSGRGCRGGV